MVVSTTRYILEIDEFIARKKVSILSVKYSLIDMILLCALGFILVLQLYLQFVQKINWDEFFYLSHIYDAQAGRLDKTLQMGHVYLFRWLPLLPGGEIAQITIGRVVMWAVQLGTLTLIIKTARRLMPLTYAIFASLCFLGLGFVYAHGTSFRADPLAGLCMMLAIYLFVVSDFQRKDIIILSFALMLGVFVTIKVALFAPLFSVLALWRLVITENKKLLLIKYVMALVITCAAFLTALLLHKLTLTQPGITHPSASFSSTFETVFLSEGFFPRKKYMEEGFFTGLIPILMICLGIMAASFCAFKNKFDRGFNLVLISLALPLLSFIFYRNSYPYFYAFIFPSAVILAGYAAYRMRFSNLFLAALSGFIILSTVSFHKTRLDDTRYAQEQTLKVVHQVFPEPVSYFDRNGMIASFPKAGFFMSSWGLRNYNMAGEHQFIAEMETKTIPLLIDNSPAISAALKGEPTSLFEEDAKALRENYIPHWGHIWVAGKKLSTNNMPSTFLILVPGDYTLKSSNPILVDGKLYENGSVLYLDRGKYEIKSHVKQDIVLRWGRNLVRPNSDPLSKPIFGAF